MANPDIGTVACPIEHGCTGRVRQYSRGSQKLYWVCKHGMITPNLEPGQQYIRDNMKPLEPDEAAAAEKPAAPKTEPKPKAKSWLSSLLEDDDE